MDYLVGANTILHRSRNLKILVNILPPRSGGVGVGAILPYVPPPLLANDSHIGIMGKNSLKTMKSVFYRPT